MRHSRPFRPGRDPHFLLFSFIHVMDDLKKGHTNFQVLLEISLAPMVEIVVEFVALSIILKFTP